MFDLSLFFFQIQASFKHPNKFSWIIEARFWHDHDTGTTIIWPLSFKLSRLWACKGGKPVKSWHLFCRHERTWMGWPDRTDNWKENAEPAQHAYAEVICAISRFEPVTLCVNLSQVQNLWSTYFWKRKLYLGMTRIFSWYLRVLQSWFEESRPQSISKLCSFFWVVL